MEEGNNDQRDDQKDDQKDSQKDSLKNDLEIYKRLASKFKLPEFEHLKNYLELSYLEDDDHLLISIKKKLVDKIKHYIDILEPIVHPDTSVNSMYESRFFTEDEKNRLFDIYKQFMVLLRSSDLTSLDESDSANAGFISEFFIRFESIKPELEKTIKKQMDSWERDETTKIDVGYLG